jgi:hypothetical protein
LFLDAQPTIPDIFAHHAENCGSHNLFIHADGEDIKSITYAQAYHAQLKATHVVQAAYERRALLHPSHEEHAVIGILASLVTLSRAFARSLPDLSIR